MSARLIKQVFVTGASGFVGQHLCRLVDSTPDWRAIPTSLDFDLRDEGNIARTLDALSVPPEAVVHLAAQASVPQSFADPDTTFDINFFGTLRLLRALKRIGFRGRFLFVSTADAYGLVDDQELPIHEDHPLHPRNPYAVSKAAAEALVYQWSQTENIDGVIARPFNHIGPGQDDRFAVGSFALQVAGISLGKVAPMIDVGDIDAMRDFTDVRDVARAYLALLSHGERGCVYNIGSGSEVRVGDILQRLLELANVDARVVGDPARLRPAEQKRMRADTRRLRDATGWLPSIEWDQTLIDTLNDWKRRLTHE